MINEIWVDVLGYEGLYQVSNLGKIKSLPRFKKSKWGTLSYINGCDIKPKVSNRGYIRVGLSKDGKQTPLLAHRIVAKAFIVNTENKPHINHIDGNKLNNHISNLEWCYHRENILHAMNTLGIIMSHSGSKNGLSKAVYQINDIGVVVAKFDCIRDTELLGFSSACVSLVCRGKQKKHKGYHWSFDQTEQLKQAA